MEFTDDGALRIEIPVWFFENLGFQHQIIVVVLLAVITVVGFWSFTKWLTNDEKSDLLAVGVFPGGFAALAIAFFTVHAITRIQ